MALRHALGTCNAEQVLWSGASDVQNSVHFSHTASWQLLTGAARSPARLHDGSVLSAPVGKEAADEPAAARLPRAGPACGPLLGCPISAVTSAMSVLCKKLHKLGACLCWNSKKLLTCCRLRRRPPPPPCPPHLLRQATQLGPRARHRRAEHSPGTAAVHVAGEALTLAVPGGLAWCVREAVQPCRGPAHQHPIRHWRGCAAATLRRARSRLHPGASCKCSDGALTAPASAGRRCKPWRPPPRPQSCRCGPFHAAAAASPFTFAGAHSEEPAG